jgi:glycosyltransferase involved in cell wall biosynthesis
LVFAGNAYLAAYAKQYNPNVVIIPTTLDTVKHKLVNKSPTERVCIGWSGSFSTVPHFELAIPALEILQKQYGEKVYFKVIGDSRYVNNQLGIQGIAWSAERELEELAEIDIGIMPLPDDEWSKGKCGFKGLLYMSLGIPAVLSPVGVNTTIITHGENGFLAGSTGEWVDVLSMLVENASLRKSIGLQGRKTVEEKYSVEAWQAKYLALFEGLTN